MDNQSLKILLQKLNGHCGQALEQAVGFASSRGQYQVTPEHLVLKLLEVEGLYNLDAVLTGFSVSQDQLWYDLIEAINNLRSGGHDKPCISNSLYRVLEKACVLGALHYNQNEIDSGLILEAVVELSSQSSELAAFNSLMRINLVELRAQREHIVRDSSEQNLLSNSTEYSKASGTERSSALEQFTLNLTEKALKGELDAITGRSEEVRMSIDILCRRRKNNPILVGEPGVGKTAIVEGLALKVAEGTVPEQLKDIQICVLDMGLLQAGAGVKGEFERRLKQVIEDVTLSPVPVMLFIDEAHTLVGAGGDAGLSDAANLLKPALARGELRTIAATTFSEYKKYFERDPALARRFQKVQVEEPDTESAMLMLSSLKESYQKHHNVVITDAAIEAAVKLSKRYINGRYLPDKAIDLIDTAAARITMDQHVKPALLEMLQERQQYLTTRLTQIKSEEKSGLRTNSSLLETLNIELDQCMSEIEQTTDQWLGEFELVEAIKKSISVGEISSVAVENNLKHNRELREKLAKLQQQKPYVQPEVNELAIADVVADWTGVPVGRMSKDDHQAVISFESVISQKVVGQTQALAAIGQALRSAKAGLSLNEGPVGCFLLSGPSGVGKTETARAIAEHLFGSDNALVTINMSEYQEAHAASQLKGAPPGYVGYGQGGVLTEAIRNRPYSVVLLDEVEKAHTDVMNMFYQVFDKGFMRDGEGRIIDFSHSLILMTSNLGSAAIQERFKNDSMELNANNLEVPEVIAEPWSQPSLTELVELIRPSLEDHFAPALLGRITTIPFNSLQKESLSTIVTLKLDKIATRLKEQYEMTFRVSDVVIDNIVEQCELNSAGARYVSQLIERNVMPNVANSLLQFVADEDIPDILSLVISDGNLECIFSDRQSPALAQSA
ncbi:type VI secretion system ATPase TssH [Reinekea sp.]|uniref:type VI secretion system ATPase TssH n=1 Tax=Reinekea sp. TaxID=1970455 RepID=UPI00398918AE